jgi:hypothetical protein
VTPDAVQRRTALFDRHERPRIEATGDRESRSPHRERLRMGYVDTLDGGEGRGKGAFRNARNLVSTPSRPARGAQA